MISPDQERRLRIALVKLATMKQRQEERVSKMQELAKMAREGNRDESQRQLRLLDSQPRVTDYGNIIAELLQLNEEISG